MYRIARLHSGDSARTYVREELLPTLTPRQQELWQLSRRKKKRVRELQKQQRQNDVRIPINTNRPP